MLSISTRFDLSAQNLPSRDQVQEQRLTTFADSLERLMLGHKTSETLYLADSLLALNSQEISPGIIRIQAAKANAYELLYDFESALEIYNSLIEVLESHEYVKEEIDVYLSLARVYEVVNKPELCQRSLNRALMLIDTYDHPEKRSRYFIRAASFQRIFEDRDLAREYAQRGVELGLEFNVLRSIGDGNLLLGILTEDFEKSISHFEMASRQFHELGDDIGSNFQKLNIARKYVRNGNYDKALSIVNDVAEYIETIDDNERVYYQFKIRIATVSEQLYSELGDKDAVINSLKQKSKYDQLLGNLVNQEKIDQLVFDNIIRQEKNRFNYARNLNWMLGVSIVCLLGILGLLSKFYLKNRTQRREIQVQKRELEVQYLKTEELNKYQSTLLSEVHHRIKNNLQLINSLLALQKSKALDESHEDVFDMLHHRVTSISLIHEQLYKTKEFDKVDVRQYVQNLLNNFSTLINESGVDINHDIDNVAVNLETITPLGLIWSELISNSLKSNKDRDDLKIFFKLAVEDDAYVMHYHDDGRGYPDGYFKSNQKGMGYIIIQSLSKQLAAEAKSYNDSGAHYFMRFKEKVISSL